MNIGNKPEVTIKESIDRLTEPSYTWHRPSKADEVAKEILF